MTIYFVVTQYNNESNDNDDAYSLGIYTTQQLAIEYILRICKEEYIDIKKSKDNFDKIVATWFKDNNEIICWMDFKQIIKKKLLDQNKTDGLSYFTYSINKHIINK